MQKLPLIVGTWALCGCAAVLAMLVFWWLGNLAASHWPEIVDPIHGHSLAGWMGCYAWHKCEAAITGKREFA